MKNKPYAHLAIHYFTAPCGSFSPYGLRTTENKAEVTCISCLNSKELPRHSKKRGTYVKAEPIKIADVPPVQEDHFKYRRIN